jgi:hypothetical protein
MEKVRRLPAKRPDRTSIRLASRPPEASPKRCLCEKPTSSHIKLIGKVLAVKGVFYLNSGIFSTRRQFAAGASKEDMAEKWMAEKCRTVSRTLD